MSQEKCVSTYVVLDNLSVSAGSGNIHTMCLDNPEHICINPQLSDAELRGSWNKMKPYLRC